MSDDPKRRADAAAKRAADLSSANSKASAALPKKNEAKRAQEVSIE
jgi:hypothetical protein